MPTYQTFPTTVIGPTYPVESTVEPRILKVEFGDGYTQEAPDGINYLLYKFNLSWETLTTSEKDIIKNFIEARGGYQTFLWVDPDGTTRKVKCRSWSISNIQPQLFSCRATFEEVPL